MLHSLDVTIIAWFRHLADYSWMIDYSLLGISNNNLLKGGVFLTVVWWFWFRPSPDQPRNRALVAATLAAGLLAIAINQTLLVTTPLRVRPYMADLPDIDFPYDLGIETRNSFPSDHASLFFALATGFFFISRPIGIAAWLYTIVVICIPRICLGLHYPSDLAAGAVIGVASACLIVKTRIRDRIARPALKWEAKHPALFYSGFFLFSYQIATLFDDLRDLGNWLKVLLHQWRR